MVSNCVISVSIFCSISCLFWSITALMDIDPMTSPPEGECLNHCARCVRGCFLYAISGDQSFVSFYLSHKTPFVRVNVIGIMSNCLMVLNFVARNRILASLINFQRVLCDGATRQSIVEGVHIGWSVERFCYALSTLGASCL